MHQNHSRQTLLAQSQDNPDFLEYQAWLKAGAPKEELVDALLDSLARQEILKLEVPFNSPIHKAMLRLTRRVWELKECLDQQR